MKLSSKGAQQLEIHELGTAQQRRNLGDWPVGHSFGRFSKTRIE
jgi:hypothetical protein